MCSNIDWPAIRAEYINSDTSYSALARKYGVSFSYVAEKGRKEGWPQERRKLAQKTADKYIESRAEAQCASLLALTRASDNLANALERLSQQLVDEDGKADAKSIEAFARTVNLNAEALRNLYGIPTQAQKHSQQLAEERLEMERKRLEMEIRESEKEHNAEPVRFVIVRPDEVSGNA